MLTQPFSSARGARAYLAFLRARCTIFLAAPVCVLGASARGLRAAFVVEFIALFVLLMSLSLLAMVVAVVNQKGGSLLTRVSAPFSMFHLADAAEALGCEAKDLRRRIFIQSVAFTLGLVLVAVVATVAASILG